MDLNSCERAPLPIIKGHHVKCELVGNCINPPR